MGRLKIFGQSDLHDLAGLPRLGGSIADDGGLGAVIHGGAGLLALQRAIDELLHLGEVGLGEPLGEGAHALGAGAVDIVDHGLVLLRHGGDADGALGAHDLGLHMVAIGSGAAHMDHAHGAVLKLVHGHAGLVVTGLLELRVLEGGAHGVDLGGLAAQEPAHQVDVVDGHVQENAAGGLGEIDAIAEMFVNHLKSAQEI